MNARSRPASALRADRSARTPPLRADGQTAEAQLQALIDRYAPAIAAIARDARRRLHAQLPPAFELVYDNYNALVIGYSPSARTSDAVMSIALYPAYVRLFFLFGAGLPDPAHLLEGQGRRVRSLVLRDGAEVDSAAVCSLVAQAVARAPTPFGAATAMTLDIRALGAKLRPRRPTAKPRARMPVRTGRA